MLELLAKTAYAANLDTVLLKINFYIINPLIRVLFALAFLIFVWGIIQYVLYRDSADEKSQGRKHIIWGLIGLFIMTSVFFFLRLIIQTFGLEEVNINESANQIEIQNGQVIVQ